jgi:hypothetical protein
MFCTVEKIINREAVIIDGSYGYRDALAACRRYEPDSATTYRVVARPAGKKAFVVYINSNLGREHVPQHCAPRGVTLMNVVRSMDITNLAAATMLRDQLAPRKARLPG